MKFIKKFEKFLEGSAEPAVKPATPTTKPDTKPTRPSKPSPIRRDKPSVSPDPKAKLAKASAEDVVMRANELSKNK